MKIRMSKNLRLTVDEMLAHSELGSDKAKRLAATIEALQVLEAQGDAQRVLMPDGDIKWMPTRQLRDHLRDLRLDAEDDEESARDR